MLPSPLRRWFIFAIIGALIALAIVFVVVWVDHTNKVRTTIGALERTRQKVDSLWKKDLALGRDYIAADNRAYQAGRKRHDNVVGANPSSEFCLAQAEIELSAVAELKSYTERIHYVRLETADAFADAIGHDATEKYRSDENARYEARSVQWSSWGRAIQMIRDDLKILVRGEIPSSDHSDESHLYQASDDARSKANALLTAVLYDRDRLNDRLNSRLAAERKRLGAPWNW